jgi:hypothetical protein
MLEIILGISLLTTVSLLGLAIWYIRQMIQVLNTDEETKEDLIVRLASFSAHVQSVYEMELFYGDQTLKGLLTHSKDLTDYIENWAHQFQVEDNTNLENEEVETLEES